MLTRLQIDGFKNLREVHLRFGPLTCIAGRNGVGKSNLFDAIAFLGDLASMPLLKAAVRVRGTGGRLAGVRHIFGHYGSDTPSISFVAEMVVPRQVLDDFDRNAAATATCLRYSLRLALKHGGADSDAGESLYIESERLEALSLEHATAALHFGPSKAWCKRYLLGPGNRTTPFIATQDGAITLFGDKGSKGRPPAAPASKTPQTVLSGVNSSTHPTALAARRELQSWHLLQLEPTALRAPDEYNGDKSISATGQHLPNALRRIGCQFQLANLLSELIPGVISVEVDSDEARQQRTLQVRMRDRQLYDASALSDGTLT